MKITALVVVALVAAGVLALVRSRSAPVRAWPAVWPALPTTGFLTGRPATQADVKAGNAVFATEGPGSVRAALAIVIPQYGYHVDEKNGRRTPVIVVQAERAGELEIIGYRDLSGRDGAGLRSEFELLGAATPNKPQSPLSNER